VKKTAETEAAGCGLFTAHYYSAQIEKMDEARYRRGKYDGSVLKGNSYMRCAIIFAVKKQ